MATKKYVVLGVDVATGADMTAVVAVPMAEPEGGWPADEFTGEPGHFVRDPFTGLRSRAMPPMVATGEPVALIAEGQ